MISTDLRQTEEYSNYMRAIGWSIISLKSTGGHAVQGFIRKIPLLGNVLKVQRYTGKLNDISGASVVYLEPINHAPRGFEKAKSCFVPSKTIQIDLTKSEEILLKNMKPKTRYNVKVAGRNGVKIERSQDINSFLDLWHTSARERGMWLSQGREIEALWRSFKKDAFLYFASIGDDVLAGIFVIHTKESAYYMYAASTKNGKEFFAPTLLTWEAINVAKKSGKKIFDFDGVFDERYENTKDWKGFTKFKEGFGGEVVTYPGTFVRYFNLVFKLLGI